MTWRPRRLRASRCGSAVHIRNAGDVLGILLNGCRRTIVERYLTVAQRLRHLDGVPREDPIIVRTFRKREASRCLLFVALEQSVDVVRPFSWNCMNASKMNCGSRAHNHAPWPSATDPVALRHRWRHEQPARSGTATGSSPRDDPDARTCHRRRSDHP